MEKIIALENGNAPKWVKDLFDEFFKEEILKRDRKGLTLFNKNGFRHANCYYEVFKAELEKVGFEVSKYYDMVSVEW